MFHLYYDALTSQKPFPNVKSTPILGLYSQAKYFILFNRAIAAIDFHIFCLTVQCFIGYHAQASAAAPTRPPRSRACSSCPCQGQQERSPVSLSPHSCFFFLLESRHRQLGPLYCHHSLVPHVSDPSVKPSHVRAESRHASHPIPCGYCLSGP